MLQENITPWDFIWIIQMILSIIAIYIAYKEGEKKGYENGRRCRSNKHYKLPNSYRRYLKDHGVKTKMVRFNESHKLK